MQCLIISGGEYSQVKLNEKYDLVIACDKGYLNAKKMKIKPDIIIGDFDSSKIPKIQNEKINIIKVSSIKDDTDTGLAIKYALRNNYKNIDIICALGNRLDHTIANIQMLKFILENAGIGRIINKDREIFLLGKGIKKIKKDKNKYLSIFSYSNKTKIDYIKGTKYELKNKMINNSFPLGVSNEFKDEYARISVKSGEVLVIIEK